MLTWEGLGKKIGASMEELEQVRYLDYLCLSEDMFVEMARWCVEYNRKKSGIVQAIEKGIYPRSTGLPRSFYKR